MRKNMGLFRGKRLKDGEWIYGSLIVYPDGYCSICSYSDCNDILNKFDVIPETVGEFTGLTDKNGKKIFEGDIVKGDIPELFPDYTGRIGFVRYNKSAYIVNFSNLYPKWELERVGFCSFNNYEVIGNIHDNPELMKGEERK